MSSLTLKGKPSEQTPLAPANSSAPVATAASNTISGKQIAHSFILLLNVISIIITFLQTLSFTLHHGCETAFSPLSPLVLCSPKQEL